MAWGSVSRWEATGNRAVYNAEAMSNLKWIAGRRGGIALGVVLSVAAGGAYLAGLLDGLNNVGLDLHFRYLGDVPADPRIVLIDIDDQSLAALADWPWPRRLYADLVRTIHELGAKTIALDVILDRPMSPRVEHATLGPHYDLDTALTVIGEPESDARIYDDNELATAMSLTEVYLPMVAKLEPAGTPPGVSIDEAIGFVRQNSDATLSIFESAFGGADHTWSERIFIEALLIARLERQFTLSKDELTKALSFQFGDARELVRVHFAEAKRMAARRAARRYFDGQSPATLPKFLESVLLAEEIDELSADRECLIDAYRAENARRRVMSRFGPVPERAKGHIQRAYDPVFPLDKFAEIADGIGLVSFGKDKSGGVVRAVPMFADLEGSLVWQLGFKIGLKELSQTKTERETGIARRAVPPQVREPQFPVDETGRTLINWHVPQLKRGRADWRDSFDHVPAARVLEISACRRAMEDNGRRLALAKFELLQARHADTRAELARYVDLVHKRDAIKLLASPASNGVSYGVLQASAKEMEPLESEISTMEQEAAEWLRRVETLWRNETPRDVSETRERDRIRRLVEWFAEDKLATRVTESNLRLENRIDDLRKELAPRVAEKVCLIGYTATGVADLITTPIHTQAPGVIAHANIINMVLQNRFLSHPSPKWDFTFVVLAGVAATVAACAGGWRFSLAALVVVGSVLVVIGAAAFRLTSIHTASFPAAAALAGVWGGVTLYRQSTEERARRRLHRALTQYTSPAIAAQIAERFDRATLAPRAATVTCFFSDLRGFTWLSERLGPERTRNVLNPYLETVSRILLDRGAMVNKFIGDGIFAFFNAPIRVCSDHARAACEAALASRDAILELNQRLSPELGGESLVMRVGISTGEAFVGDYGSEMKLDYTCIGDTVNLGSRLEQANKLLGTTILADDRTRHAADGFAFRPIGRIAVPGRSTPACVYELVEQPRTADPDFVEFCDLSARAIAYYQACEWDSCLAVLAECRTLRPDDRVSALYVRSVETLRRIGRPPQWGGALQIGVAETGPL